MNKIKYFILFTLLTTILVSSFSYAGFEPEPVPAAPFAMKDQRLLSVFDYLLSVSEGGEGLTVDCVKTVIDFAGNEYRVAECVPTGYIIYNVATGIFAEYSTTAVSPYRDALGTLYYGGPTYYYEQKEPGGEAVGLLEPTERLTTQELHDAAEAGWLFGRYNEEQINANVLSYVENGDVHSSFAQVMESVAEPAAMEYGKLTHSPFFVDNTNPCGYLPGCCAYTALAMIYAYRDKYRSDNYMDEIYWVNSTKVKLADGILSFAYYLRTQFGTVDDPTIDGIKAVSEAYCKARGITVSHTVKKALGFSRKTIMEAIDNDTPVMMVGNFTIPSTGTKGEHAIVAYAYKNNTSLFGTTTYVVHFGYNGYSNVNFSETIASIYMLG